MPFDSGSWLCGVVGLVLAPQQLSLDLVFVSFALPGVALTASPTQFETTQVVGSCLSAKDCEGIPTALQQGCRRIHVAYGAASSGGGGSPVLVNAPDEARNLESETIPVGVDSNAQVPSVCGCF